MGNEALGGGVLTPEGVTPRRKSNAQGEKSGREV